MYDKYVLSLGHRMCQMNKDSVSFVNEINNATVFNTIGDAMRNSAYLVGELGVNTVVKRLE